MKATEYIFDTTHTERQIIAALGAACLVLGGLYVYFVAKSVSNVVVRKELEQQIAAAYSTLGELESRYINRTNAVTLELARARGFREVDTEHYVVRGAAETVTLRGGGR